ncbi:MULTISPECIES: DUF418 domain-containing protein [unclassified Carboxylicivirga]|uniref:DUF418 domain-containing protein n=1 Tax=Carboxylicivirga TaxID=1628153 RepID=UPI003D34DB8D
MENGIASFLFYLYSLHLSQHCGVSASVFIGLTLVLIQIILSYWWLSKYKQDPLEYLWHKASYFKVIEIVDNNYLIQQRPTHCCIGLCFY